MMMMMIDDDYLSILGDKSQDRMWCTKKELE